MQNEFILCFQVVAAGGALKTNYYRHKDNPEIWAFDEEHTDEHNQLVVSELRLRTREQIKKELIE